MADDRFFSAGADRSWTDAISNQVVLRGLDARAYLEWLNTRKVRIEPIIPQFLHEITHHWCFDSRVGRAVALLRLRAGMRAAFDTSRDHALELAADVAKYEAARTLLKPIAEGLALFAEFDTRSGPMNVVSQPLQALQMCFGFLLDHERGPELTLLALLQNTRLRREFLNDRKANLYLRRFDCDDGYLPGYLTIKTLEGRLRIAAPELEDPDLFLCYVRSFVFEDAVLARTLLEKHPDELSAANAVARRICDRLADLGRACEGLHEQPLLRANVQQYDEAVASGRGPEALARPIMITEAEIGAAEKTFEAAAIELLEGIDGETDTEKIVAGSIIANLQLRRFAEVASAPAIVGIDEAGARAVLDTRGEALCSLPDDVPVESGASGDLIAIISSTANYIALVLHTEDDFHLVKWIGGKQEDDDAAVVHFATVHSLCNQIFEVLENALDSAVAESWLTVVRDKIRREALRMATDLYLTLSTLNVRDEALAVVREAMLSKGIRSFLDDDPDVARTLAMVGLVNGFTVDSTTIRAFGKGMLDLAEDDVAAALEKLHASEQFPLVLGAGASLHALV